MRIKNKITKKAEHPKCPAFFTPQICQSQKARLILSIQRKKNQHNDCPLERVAFFVVQHFQKEFRVLLN